MDKVILFFLLILTISSIGIYFFIFPKEQEFEVTINLTDGWSYSNLYNGNLYLRGGTIDQISGHTKIELKKGDLLNVNLIDYPPKANLFLSNIYLFIRCINGSGDIDCRQVNIGYKNYEITSNGLYTFDIGTIVSVNYDPWISNGFWKFKINILG